MDNKLRFFNEKEPYYQSILAQHFRSLIRHIEHKAFTKSSVSEMEQELIPSTDDWRGVLANIIFEQDKQSLEAGVKNTQDVYGLPQFSLEHSGAISWLKTQASDTATSVRDGLLDKARDVIRQNLEQDVADPQQMRDDIAQLLSDEANWRIDRIVRTELATAYTNGTMTSYKASNLVDKVQWIIADDERTCEECLANADQIVDMGDVFRDGSDEPPSHPNCRCDVIPYWGEEADKDYSDPEMSKQFFDFNAFDEKTKDEVQDSTRDYFHNIFPQFDGFTDTYTWKVRLMDVRDIEPAVVADPDKADKYGTDMLNGAKFPPIIVTKLPSDNVATILDGNHRYEAITNLGAKKVYVLYGVPKGTE